MSLWRKVWIAEGRPFVVSRPLPRRASVMFVFEVDVPLEWLRPIGMETKAASRPEDQRRPSPYVFFMQGCEPVLLGTVVTLPEAP